MVFKEIGLNNYGITDYLGILLSYKAFLIKFKWIAMEQLANTEVFSDLVSYVFNLSIMVE